MKTFLNLTIALALSAIFIVGSAFTVNKENSTKITKSEQLTGGDELLSGCLGICGYRMSTAFVFTESGTHDLKFQAISDLCPALGAKVLVRKNGQTVYLGDVSGGADVDFQVSPGDLIQMDGEIFLKVPMNCNPRGQVDMSIIQLN